MIILKIILLIILYLLLFLLGLLLILIVSPIKGRLQFNVKTLNFTGSYIFGLIKVHYYNKRMTLRILGFKIYRTNTSKSDDERNSEETNDENEPVKEKKRKDRKKKDKKFKRPSIEIIKIALNTLKKLIKIIAPDEFTIRLTLGIDEPYYIGLADLFLNMFAMPLNRFEGYNIKFIPIYDDIAIDYEGRIKVNFSIIRLIIPCLRFILKKPIRQYLGLFQFKKKKSI